jgi:predicted ABC-type ATPase
MPELHVVAGPNGAGKTTIFKNLVPRGLDYINADLIAKTIKEKAGGLNTQDIANREAAKIFYEKASKRESFAIETNLYDVDTYKSFRALQAEGYQILIYFLAVDDVEICIDRVKLRVSQGGHNVNPDVIRERYTLGISLLKHYKNFPDVLILMDNSDGILRTVLELHNGVVHQQANPCKNWVKTIMEQTPPQESAGKTESIEEVRKLYQKGKGLK